MLGQRTLPFSPSEVLLHVNNKAGLYPTIQNDVLPRMYNVRICTSCGVYLRWPIYIMENVLMSTIASCKHIVWCVSEVVDNVLMSTVQCYVHTGLASCKRIIWCVSEVVRGKR